MKGTTLNRQHLRPIAVRTLTTASCIGGLLTLIFGAWIVPWIADVGQWLIHQIPWWHQVGTFPNVLRFLAVPDLRLSLIWLAYYLITYLWAVATLSPRQQLALRTKIAQEYREKDDEWDLNSSGFDTYHQAPQPKEAIPLSQAWPGELKHQLVEHCYEQYRKALKRFDPPPLDLKTPLTFSYRKAGQIEWRDSTLVLPEQVLTPERIHELLPFLAHFLYDYNAEHITTEETHGFPDHVPLAALLFITGNFLWLPVLSKHNTEEEVVRDSHAQQRELVLERDTFAVLLGQGPALEHQLRRVEEELKKRSETDKSVPTLIERIGHLEVLNEQERQEMRQLGLNPKRPPLVGDPPFGQIGKGKNRKP